MNEELKPHVQRLARAVLRNGRLRGQLFSARLKAGNPRNELEGFLFDFLLELRKELRERVQ